jgi:S1-C subfamily serine protease
MRPIRLVLIVLILPLLTTQAFPFQAASAEAKGWMGVYLDNDPVEGEAGEQDADILSSVVVRRVVEDSPAARAGLRARDRIVSIDGAPATDYRSLVSRVGRMAPGTWVTLDLRRGRRDLQVRVRLGERPARLGTLRPREGWIGVETIDLTPSLREHFGAPEDAGVLVSHIEEGSPAAAGGLLLGDVIFDLYGFPASSSREVAQRIAGGGIGNSVEITLMRNGSEMVVEVEIATAPRDRDE